MMTNDRNRRTLLALVCATPALVPAGVTQAADGVPPGEPVLAEALPEADPGHCYAKVALPARHDRTPVEVVIEEASERFLIEPAVLEADVETIVTMPAHRTLTAVQPVMRDETIRVESPVAGSRWVRHDSSSGPIDATAALPPSAAEWAALSDAGLDPEALAPGTCVSEFHRPAGRRDSEHRVLVREASTAIEVRPAELVADSVEITLVPEHGRLVEIPAVYIDDSVEVITESGHTTWKPGRGPIQRIDNVTGEIMCRVDVPPVTERIDVQRVETPAMVTRIAQPAETEIVEIRRLVKAASSVSTPVAARFETLTLEHRLDDHAFLWALDGASVEEAFEPTGRQLCHIESAPAVLAYEREVVAEPGRVETREVAAETVERAVQRLVADASFDTLPVDAVTRTLIRRTQTEAARVEWRPVLCETNVTPEVVRSLQQALEDAGHSPNGVDGLLGPGTMGAIERLQRAERLGTGGITLEVFEHLGLSLQPIAPDANVADLSDD